MNVRFEIEEAELDGDYTTIDGLRATCRRCGHEVDVYGTSDRSERRCGVMLREECPRNERNFYVPAGGE